VLARGLEPGVGAAVDGDCAGVSKRDLAEDTGAGVRKRAAIAACLRR